MKTKLLFSIFLLVSTFSFSQNWQWATGVGGTSYDLANDIYTDGNGNSYITGWYQNTVNFGPSTLTSNGGYDFYVARYNVAGVCIWASGAGGSMNDIGYGVTEDANGNTYVTGTFQGTVTFGSTQLTSLGSADVFVAKYDISGFCVWASSGGGTLDDQGQAITLDTAGNVIVNGYFKNTGTFGSTNLTSYGNSDVFTAKLNGTTGAWMWAQDGGGSLGDNGYGVTTDASSNIYITGYFRGSAFFSIYPLSSAGGDDIFIVKYNSSGAVQWAKSAGGTMDDHGNGIVADLAGDVYLTGWFKGGAASFGTNNVTASGTNEEVFVTKYNTSGTPQWAVSAGSASYELGTGICLDENTQGPVISGTFQANFTLGTNALVASGLGDFFVAEYTPAGVPQWALAAGGSGSDVAYKLHCDGLGNVYTAGSFSTTCNFGMNALTSQGIADIFVAKIDPTLSGINSNANEETGFQVYPNPTKGVLFVTSGESNPSQLILFNSIGEQAKKWMLSNGKNQIDISDLAPGIYFLSLQQGNKTESRKLIVE